MKYVADSLTVDRPVPRQEVLDRPIRDSRAANVAAPQQLRLWILVRPRRRSPTPPTAHASFLRMKSFNTNTSRPVPP